MFVQMETDNGPEWINVIQVRRVTPNTAGTNGAEPRCTLHYAHGETVGVKQDAAETAAHMTGALMGLVAALGTAAISMLQEASAAARGEGGNDKHSDPAA